MDCCVPIGIDDNYEESERTTSSIYLSTYKKAPVLMHLKEWLKETLDFLILIRLQKTLK